MITVGDKVKLKSLDDIWSEGNQVVNMCYTSDVDGDIWGMECTVLGIVPSHGLSTTSCGLELVTDLPSYNGGSLDEKWGLPMEWFIKL